MSTIPEHPILFNGEMVRAILAGRKTQTRRVITPQPEHERPVWAFAENVRDGHSGVGWYCAEEEYPDEGSFFYRCPYGHIGHRLWVRETHWCYGQWVKNGKTRTGKQAWKFQAMSHEVRFSPQPKTSDRTVCGWYQRPSIFLPLGTARIKLEITDIRVQRVQEISEEDARAEGVEPEAYDGHGIDLESEGIPTFSNAFQTLWNTINAGRGLGWDANPWVWAIAFKKVEVPT